MARPRDLKSAASLPTACFSVAPVVLVLAAPMLGALQAVLVLAEPCPRMAEREARADRQEQQVKAEGPYKVEAHKRQAGQPPRSAQIESRTRGVASRVAPPAKQLAKRVGPRCRARARVAVAATSGASQGNGTNCCWFSARWDSGGAGGVAPPMKAPPVPGDYGRGLDDYQS